MKYVKKPRNLYKSPLSQFSMVFDKIRKAFSDSVGEDLGSDEYLEIDLEQQEKENKVLVKLFVLKDYDDVNNILSALREGYTIAIIDFRILKQKDAIELKRAISKIKKTVDALEGSIAGHENIVIVTPAFAKIYKEADRLVEKKDKFDTYWFLNLKPTYILYNLTDERILRKFIAFAETKGYVVTEREVSIEKTLGERKMGYRVQKIGSNRDGGNIYGNYLFIPTGGEKLEFTPLKKVAEEFINPLHARYED